MCINVGKSSSKEICKSLFKYILDVLDDKYKIIFVTDKSIESITYNMNISGIDALEIKSILDQVSVYNYSLDRNISENFKKMLQDFMVDKEKNYRILWDLTNILHNNSMLKELINFTGNILKYQCKNNIENYFYVLNKVYEGDLLSDLCRKFNNVIIHKKGKELNIRGNNEINNTMYLLQECAEIEEKNKSMCLFNKTMLNIPKDDEKEQFQNNVKQILKEICDIDFCVIYTSLNGEALLISNCIGMDDFYINCITNDDKIVNLEREYSEYILKTKESLFLVRNNLRKCSLKDALTEMKIQSMAGVYVKYDSNIEGVIWVGKWDRDDNIGVISRENSDYIKCICRTVFHCIVDRDKLFSFYDKFLENEKLKTIGETSFEIVHDINNVLTPVMGSVQILKDKYKCDNIIQRYLKVIEICINDAAHITDKIKKMAKNFNDKEDKDESFNINEVLIDVIHLMENKLLAKSNLEKCKYNIDLVTQLNSSARVKGNSTELREVFINLVSNAMDAVNYNGEIKILSSDTDGYVVLEIIDNGIGMNEEVKKKVFQPFFTTKGNKGCGLGISISQKIVKSYGGDIEIISEEGIGTCLRVKLPICAEEYFKENFIHEDNIYFDGNVLIIDDKENVRNIISEIIKSICNCKIKKINPDSIEKVKNELKQRNYDIVICDFSMPNLNGVEVAKLAKEINKNTYFCLMTGWIGKIPDEDLEDIDDIIYKPISKKRIGELLLEYSKHVLV